MSINYWTVALLLGVWSMAFYAVGWAWLLAVVVTLGQSFLDLTRYQLQRALQSQRLIDGRDDIEGHGALVPVGPNVPPRRGFDAAPIPLD